MLVKSFKICSLFSLVNPCPYSHSKISSSPSFLAQSNFIPSSRPIGIASIWRLAHEGHRSTARAPERKDAHQKHFSQMTRWISLLVTISYTASSISWFCFSASVCMVINRVNRILLTRKVQKKQDRCNPYDVCKTCIEEQFSFLLHWSYLELTESALRSSEKLSCLPCCHCAIFYGWIRVRQRTAGF